MNKHTSRIVKAMQGWKEGLSPFSTPPKGQFGRVAIVTTTSAKINSEELDLEFRVPFDDDTEANEAEIIVYNLSNSTVQALKYNDTLTIEAGYKGDTGVIFAGRISKVTTKKEGLDKVTVIKALDDMNLKERDIAEITYKKGTKASYILKDLLNKVGLPIAKFEIKRDHTYKDEVKVSGALMENVKLYAKVCGISAYINKGKIYAQHLTKGEEITFLVNADTGLIGSPSESEEEVTAEDYTDVIKVYEWDMLLQHRLTTAAIVNLTSQNITGRFRVRSGEHIFNADEATTKIEAIRAS